MIDRVAYLGRVLVVGFPVGIPVTPVRGVAAHGSDGLNLLLGAVGEVAGVGVGVVALSCRHCCDGGRILLWWLCVGEDEFDRDSSCGYVDSVWKDDT